MKFIMIELIIILVILLIIIGIILILKKKTGDFLEKFWGTRSLSEAIEKSEIMDSETHKTVYSMESVYLDKIKKDFPGLNINELKSSAEMNIRNVLHAIETKDLNGLRNKNDRIYAYTQAKIEDLKDDKFICDNINFHKTVLSRYEKKDEVATMEFQTYLEYFTKQKGKVGRKKQTRFKTQFIHVIDQELYGQNKIKVLGLNCHNCGAPIKDIDNRNCEYCNSRLIVSESGVEYVKRIWFLNNLKEY